MLQETLRKGGAVKRWHTITNVKEQTVASHSWGVASILLDLWPDSSNNLIRAALWHDVAELHTGDIPAPIKWENKEFAHACDKIEKRVQKQLHLFKQLDSVEKTKLKIADLLELMWYCLEEIELGNTKFKDILLVAEKEYSKHRKVNIQADHMCDSILCRGKN